MFAHVIDQRLMSIHFKNPEVEARLVAQRRKSSVTAALVGVLLMLLIALVFWLIGINIFSKSSDPLVTMIPDAVVTEELEKVKVTTALRKIPSSPSSALVKIVTAEKASDFSIPTPDVVVDSLSVDFGKSEAFGEGWGGESGDSSGVGKGSPAFQFMQSEMKSDRVCFVIDYSQSMSGTRVELLKSELEKTIATMPDGIEYQMIFFAGPAWVAGSEVISAKMSADIQYEGKTFKWSGQGSHNWQHVGAKQQVSWLKAGEGTRADSLKAIRETKLVYGTAWSAPLEMAFDMDPKPELVVFLTDGSSGNDSLDRAKKLGDTAKTREIRVNTIALMEPAARTAMAELARRSGGEFTLIDKNGKKVKQGLKVRKRQ